MPDTPLLLITLAAIVGLIVLIAWLKVSAFIALTLAAIFVGLASGMAPLQVALAFEAGLGRTLGFIAMVIALGAVLGRLLADSHGADVIATTVTGWFGPRRMHWAVAVIAFVVGLPVFFGVGLVIIIPVIYGLARRMPTDGRGSPLMLLGIPLVAGLSCAHGLVPPHPGVFAAIGEFKADVGRTILLSLPIGLATTLLVGPLLGRWCAQSIAADPPEETPAAPTDVRPRPSFSLTLLTILMPILLIGAATVADMMWPKPKLAAEFSTVEIVLGVPVGKLHNFDDRSPVVKGLEFLRNPTVSMLIAVLFAYYSLGYRCGLNRERLLAATTECLAPVAAILLVVGAGGGFNEVLKLSGVGKAVASVMPATGGGSTQILCIGWALAAAIRVATGSATAGIIMAAGVMAPIAAKGGVDIELLVLAMGAGSLFLSHVNDGGFWLVREYLRMSVVQTLRSWSVLETVASVVALAFVLLADMLLH